MRSLQDLQGIQGIQGIQVVTHAHIGLGLSGLVGTCRDFGQGTTSRQRQ
jgi:hypothetical protein